MTREEFEKLIEEEFAVAVPEKFRHMLLNVAFLADSEAPSKDLLGQYHGIPHTARGDHYGLGGTLPDTITLYQKTIEEHAHDTRTPVAQVVRETIWHEVAHYLGYDEEQIRGREDERDS